MYSNKVSLADFHLSRKFAFLIFSDNEMSDSRDSFGVYSRNFQLEKYTKKLLFLVEHSFSSSFSWNLSPPLTLNRIYFFFNIQFIWMNPAKKLRVIGNHGNHRWHQHPLKFFIFIELSRISSRSILCLFTLNLTWKLLRVNCHIVIDHGTQKKFSHFLFFSVE